MEECEAELLSSLARPIVLVAEIESPSAPAELAPSVAPGNRRYGAMLAYAPLHHLLFEGEMDALVATSGNVLDEPIAFTNEDALERLAGIARMRF